MSHLPKCPPSPRLVPRRLEMTQIRARRRRHSLRRWNKPATSPTQHPATEVSPHAGRLLRCAAVEQWISHHADRGDDENQIANRVAQQNGQDDNAIHLASEYRRDQSWPAATNVGHANIPPATGTIGSAARVESPVRSGCDCLPRTVDGTPASRSVSGSSYGRRITAFDSGARSVQYPGSDRRSQASAPSGVRAAAGCSIFETW